MKILIVLTSHDRLGDTGKKTGFWLEEFTAPYYVLKDADADITLTSPAGGWCRSSSRTQGHVKFADCVAPVTPRDAPRNQAPPESPRSPQPPSGGESRCPAPPERPGHRP